MSTFLTNLNMETAKELALLIESLDDLLCEARRKYDELQTEVEEFNQEDPQVAAQLPELSERGDALFVEVDAFREVLEIMLQDIEVYLKE